MNRITATAASATCWKTLRRKGLLELDTDKRSRTYVVTRFGAELNAAEEGEGGVGAGPKEVARGDVRRQTQ